MKPRNAFVRSHGLSPFTLPSLVSSFSFWYVSSITGLRLSLSLPPVLSAIERSSGKRWLSFSQIPECDYQTCNKRACARVYPSILLVYRGNGLIPAGGSEDDSDRCDETGDSGKFQRAEHEGSFARSALEEFGNSNSPCLQYGIPFVVHSLRAR